MWSGTQIEFFGGNVHTTHGEISAKFINSVIYYNLVHKIYFVDYKDIVEFAWYAHWMKIVLLC